ncbi:MAG: hypothetical protein WBM44_10280 [Waterburya sp.]
MFTKLPDLLGRNFIIGYLLPSFALIVSIYLLDEQYNFLPANIDLTFVSQLGALEQVTVLGLLALLGGIILLIFNRNMIKFLEGYGQFNPLGLFAWIEKSRFKKLEGEIDEIEKEYIAYFEKDKTVPLEIKEKYRQLKQKRVVRFPDDERWLLPTSFGNILRAFETYSRVMYGADAIPIWTRLLAVIPDDYRQFIDTAKTLVDFWVNTLVVSLVVLVVYLGNVIYFQQIKLLWLPIACLIVAFITYQQAGRSAMGWGNFVKAAFDLFLEDLKQQLAISNETSDLRQDAKIWLKFSQAIHFVAPESLPEKHIKQKQDNSSS